MHKWTYKSSIKPQSWGEVELPVVWENHSQVLLSLKCFLSLGLLVKLWYIPDVYYKLFAFIMISPFEDYSIWI